MKRNKYIGMIILAGIIGLYACKKEKDFLRDNVTPTGVGFVPVCTNGLVDMATGKSLGTSTSSASVYAAGAAFNTELQFFSEGPIKEINLYNTVGANARAKAGTWPYQKAFSDRKKLDTLLVPYTVPAVASNTVIKLEYEILNQNSLNVIRTVYVKVQ